MIQKILLPVRLVVASAGLLGSLAWLWATTVDHWLAHRPGVHWLSIAGIFFLGAAQHLLAEGGLRFRPSALTSAIHASGVAIILVMLGIQFVQPSFIATWQPLLMRLYFPIFMSIAYALFLSGLITEYRSDPSARHQVKTVPEAQTSLAPWQRQFLIPMLIAIAAAGFAFSVVVQWLAFFGVTLGGNGILTLLSLGLFVPFGAMVILMLGPSPDQTKADWRIILSGCPRWLQLLVRGLMVYTPVTAALSWLMLPLGGVKPDGLDVNWAGHAFAASAAMLFYAAAAAGLLTVYHRGPSLLSR